MADIVYDLNRNDSQGFGWCALCAATEEKICRLIAQNRIDEKWLTRLHDFQEENRILRNQYQEFELRIEKIDPLSDDHLKWQM